MSMVGRRQVKGMLKLMGKRTFKIFCLSKPCMHGRRDCSNCSHVAVAAGSKVKWTQVQN